MARAFFINKTPFHRVSFFISLTIALMISLLLTMQLSGAVGGWLALHQHAPLVIVVEILPVVLILFTYTITRKSFQKETTKTYRKEKDNLIVNISGTLEKIKAGQYDKESDLTGEAVVDTALWAWQVNVLLKAPHLLNQGPK